MQKETAATVVIAEDDAFSAEQLRLDLQQAGYRVLAIVDNGQRLVEIALTHEVDILIVDIVLQGEGDGIDAVQQIRQRKSIPVIFMTAYDSTEFVRRAEAVQPTAYLLKPCRPRELSFLLKMALIRHDNETKLVVAKQNAELALWHLATHDPLTQLPNRKLLQDRLQRAIAHAQRHEEHFGVIFIDMDDFKKINDSHGHKTGDEILIRIAQRIRAALRDEDTVARLGGDEFVAVVELENGKPNESAAAIATKLQRAVMQPIDLEGLDLAPRCSCGIAVYPQDGEDPDILVSHADSAMYRAKKQRGGESDFAFYNEKISQEASRQLRLEQSLRLAVERDELEIHYQPQYRLADGQLTGFEALLRWNRPGHGRIAPEEFIPLAERCGLIAPITEWICMRVGSQLNQWSDEDLSIPMVAINLSNANALNAPLMRRLLQALQENKCPPGKIELEITESHMVQELTTGRNWVHDLHQGGFGIAIDDFGTGYSSLSYLKRLPITKLKIDRSFVQDLDRNSGDNAICRAIISMSHSLGIPTLAEGVEREGQLAFLKTEGCDMFQGFIAAPALPVAEVSSGVRSGELLRYRT